MNPGRVNDFACGGGVIYEEKNARHFLFVIFKAIPIDWRCWTCWYLSCLYYVFVQLFYIQCYLLLLHIFRKRMQLHCLFAYSYVDYKTFLAMLPRRACIIDRVYGKRYIWLEINQLIDITFVSYIWTCYVTHRCCC